MATAAILNLVPSPLCLSPSAAATFLCPDTMRGARPKSAKGRMRPRIRCLQEAQGSPCQGSPSPLPAAPQERVNSQRASSITLVSPACQVSTDNVSELLQQMPGKGSSSLNKYRVLPPIGCKQPLEEVLEQTQQLKVSEGWGDAPQIKTLSGEREHTSMLIENDEENSQVRCPPEKLGKTTRQEKPLSSPAALEESQLLLAVRSPSGQRFHHHFKPSDSLQTVLAVAEQKTSVKYEHCSIETMEVPRRNFSDLTRSLHDCEILHKSVLCIRQEERHD
ncbi:UBX10 protein, partial [Rhinopomastus cyanomelas]|nr:UBX10 protein [Rhinopomastus cyanomelas]